jgi:RNA polymerase sigma-70 factor, ECF subfamily
MKEFGDSGTGSTLFRLLGDPSDPAAWERFVGRYAPKLRAWCRQWGLGEAEAADVSQDVLLKLLTGLRTYDRRKGRFRCWLKAMARNTKSDWLTGQHKAGRPTAEVVLHSLLENQRDAVADFERTLDRILDAELLLQASQRVQLLVQRSTWEAFRRVTFDGVPVPQVARELQLTLPAVYQSVYRVKLHLQREIQTLENPDPAGRPTHD